MRNTIDTHYYETVFILADSLCFVFCIRVRLSPVQKRLACFSGRSSWDCERSRTNHRRRLPRNKQESFNEKVKAVPVDVMTEVQLSAEIIAKIDAVLKEKGMSQRDLARKLGKSEAVISRWTTGFPNLTLRSIAELSTALGVPLIKVAE